MTLNSDFIHSDSESESESTNGTNTMNNNDNNNSNISNISNNNNNNNNSNMVNISDSSTMANFDQPVHSPDDVLHSGGRVIPTGKDLQGREERRRFREEKAVC